MTAGARRAQVLAVAQDLFSREGYHHVSMDDIADRAAVSKPVLYRHFPSKLDLYLAVIDHRGAALVAAVDDALAAVTPASEAASGPVRAEVPPGREVVRAIVRAYMEFVETAGESSTLLFESDVTRDADVRSRVEHASEATAAAIRDALRELAGLGDAEAALVGSSLVGMARVAATQRYRAGDVTVAAAVDLLTRLAWRGVAGLITTEQERHATG